MRQVTSEVEKRKSKISYYSLKILFHLFLFVIFLGQTIQAAETIKEADQNKAALQEAINDLKKAIKIKDFSALKYDVPEEKPLWWGSCSPDTRIYISFDAMVDELSKTSKNIAVKINQMPVQLLYVTTVETKGWIGKNPYLYFEFKETDSGWRLLGVYDCATRSSDFRSEQGDELSDKPPAISWESKEIQKTQRFKTLIKKFKKILLTKKFEKLKIYIPDKKIYYWGECGPGDSGYDELSFKVITKMLLEESKGVEIYFNPETEIDWNLNSLSVETEGWLGEYPFLTFSFDFLKTENRWAWSGACYSATPELKVTKSGKYEATYFREPYLPRPGHRIFQDLGALQARIEEILRLKKFDALKPYATKEKLTLGECSYDMIKDEIKGKEVFVNQIIDFFKNEDPEGEKLKFSTKYYYLESEGWRDYPYIYFRFTNVKGSWQWTGVAYCKTSLTKVLSIE